MTDFGFAPGGTAQDGRLRRLFQRRAGTQLIAAQRGRTTVREFIGHLDTTPSITKPIDDALLGAHANSEGHIFIPMFPGQAGPTQFETLEDTIATAAHSVAIPDTLIGFTAGDPITHNVHFKGCNIGKAPPFLTKFKEALGDHINVTAPKHFHGLHELATHGTWEYMAYEFIIRRSTDFPTRADCVTAYQGAGFTFIGGVAIPNATWETWIPTNISATVARPFVANLGTTFGRRSTLAINRQFRVDRTRFTWFINFPTPGDVPAPADRQARFEAHVGDDPRMDSLHPYPWYERLGCASFADFIAGYTWTHTKSGRTLNTRGTRAEYTIVIPITNTKRNLIFNFHPSAGSGFTAVTNLAETDPVFFESV